MARVLVVDDAAFMRKMVSDALAKAGHEVIGEACNGVEAVDSLLALKPELTTLDITMPEKDGLSALGDIMTLDPNARVIMCSALGQESKVLESIKLGARDFVVKPFQPARVQEAVARRSRNHALQPSFEGPLRRALVAYRGVPHGLSNTRQERDIVGAGDRRRRRTAKPEWSLNAPSAAFSDHSARAGGVRPSSAPERRRWRARASAGSVAVRPRWGTPPASLTGAVRVTRTRPRRGGAHPPRGREARPGAGSRR